MGDFPRIELFTPREKLALANFSVALLAILLGAVIYTRPAVPHLLTVAARLQYLLPGSVATLLKHGFLVPLEQ